mmetsp:Transcript_141602/g.200514  ORF Transcript_141602/g.200514 Transcript_141602/m.200514 type:complete len:188 (+) Transcript_141602:57-620(+)
MASILRKAAKYRRVNTLLEEGEAHLRDNFTLPPKILKPVPRDTKSPDDITNFPLYETVPLPEAIPYAEGRYRPASIPLVQGYWPYTMYLEKGKVYNWCSCGISQLSPWCDTLCNQLVTRNRPMYFNVSESGYYKICQCKHSANAPFCNGTHRLYIRNYLSTNKGHYEFSGICVFWLGWVYILWNFQS